MQALERPAKTTSPGIDKARSSRATAIDLFLQQQAMLHQAGISKIGLHSFADEVWQDANDLLDCWGNLTKVGLLLMPPTRHNFIHLNEAMKVK